MNKSLPSQSTRQGGEVNDKSRKNAAAGGEALRPQAGGAPQRAVAVPGVRPRAAALRGGGRSRRRSRQSPRPQGRAPSGVQAGHSTHGGGGHGPVHHQQRCRPVSGHYPGV